MIDDRWSDDAEEMAAALRRVLAKHCTSERVRAAEDGNGLDAELESALAEFGLAELAGDPELLVRAAYELGAELAPTPFVGSVPALALLGRADVSDGAERLLARAGLPYVAIRRNGGIAIAPSPIAVRSAAGDALLDLRDLETVDTTPVYADPTNWRSWGWLASSAALVGAAQRLLAHTVEYVSQRHQFGQPVGAFQGVAFPMADAATSVRGAELLVRKTTYLAKADGSPPSHFAAMTAHATIRATRQTASTAHQAMGGQGFTLEADTQLYTRRIRSWSGLMPDPSPVLADLAKALADQGRRHEVTDLWQFDRGFELPRWAREAEAL